MMEHFAHPLGRDATAFERGFVRQEKFAQIATGLDMDVGEFFLDGGYTNG